MDLAGIAALVTSLATLIASVGGVVIAIQGRSRKATEDTLTRLLDLEADRARHDDGKS